MATETPGTHSGTTEGREALSGDPGAVSGAPEAVDGIEPCEDGTNNHAWVLRDGVPCDSCGDHNGYGCDTCGEFVDQFNDEAAFNRIKAQMEDR